MISKETSIAIWRAYREIETAEQLLVEISKNLQDKPPGNDQPTLRDAFGQERHLQLGIPSGSNVHRLFDVKPALAASVIRAHIQHKRAELAEANERARIELDSERQDNCGDKCHEHEGGQEAS